MPPPLTSSSGATSRTAATTAARRSAISCADALLHRVGSPRPCTALPAGGRRRRRCAPRSPSARRARSRRGARSPARAPRACSGVRIGRALGADLHAARRRASSPGRARCRRARRGRRPRRRRSGRGASAESTISDRRPLGLERGQLARAPRGRRSGRRAAGRRSRARRATASRRSVNVIRPRKPGSRVEDPLAAARRQRTDFDATRIGLPPARREHVGGVRPHRVEVDERERRVEVRRTRARSARSGLRPASVAGRAPVAVALIPR